MMDETVPEIARTNLGSTVLYLKALGIGDVLGFDFFESPGRDGLAEALRSLHALGALDARGGLTALGRDMAQLPLDPSLARMLLHAEGEVSGVLVAVTRSRGRSETDNGCVHEWPSRLRA